MRALVAALGFLAAILAAPARGQPVDLELVIAVDISRSIDDEEAKLQRDGYIAALTNPRVINAIRSGPVGAIAIAYVEWAGVQYQHTIVPWTRVADAKSAESFATQITAAPRIAANWTAISGAIDFSLRLFDENPYKGARRVIDISGDGRNNSGRPVQDARDEAVKAGITINGLPIINDRPNFSYPPERDLDLYYERNVIGGPGAFVKPAESFEAFGAAILAKLIREIAGREASGDPSSAAVPAEDRD